MQKMRSKNCLSFSIPILPRPCGQNKTPGKRHKLGGEAGDAREGKGMSQDAERVAEELGDLLPGLLPPHLNAWRCVPGHVRC
jgi:hypothetical protein